MAIDFRELVAAGVHFGHQTSRWNPNMRYYIWGKKNRIHLIDVSKTALHLERAAKFLRDVARNGNQVMWLGTKTAAQNIVQEMAATTSMPFVNHRWVGGTLSNHAQVKKSVTRLLHYEDVLAKAEKFPHYTKKELNVIKKSVERLEKNIGGIRTLRWPIGALIVVDVMKEMSAVKEAHSVGVPVIALVDTNGDPSLVDYVIPANDDTPQSIRIITEYLSKAILDGLADAKKATQDAKAKRELDAAMKAKASVVVEVQEPQIIIGLEEDEEGEEEKVRLKKGPKRPPKREEK